MIGSIYRARNGFYFKIVEQRDWGFITLELKSIDPENAVGSHTHHHNQNLGSLIDPEFDLVELIKSPVYGKG